MSSLKNVETLIKEMCLYRRTLKQSRAMSLGSESLGYLGPGPIWYKGKAYTGWVCWIQFGGGESGDPSMKKQETAEEVLYTSYFSYLKGMWDQHSHRGIMVCWVSLEGALIRRTSSVRIMGIGDPSGVQIEGKRRKRQHKEYKMQEMEQVGEDRLTPVCFQLLFDKGCKDTMWCNVLHHGPKAHIASHQPSLCPFIYLFLF